MGNFFDRWADRLRARALERRAQKLYQHGDFDEAVSAYQEALTLAGERPLTLMNMGLALYKAGRKTEARDSWNRALSLAEGRSPYLTEQITILLRQFG